MTGAIYGEGIVYPSGAPVCVVFYLLLITVDVNVLWFYESLFTPWF